MAEQKVTLEIKDKTLTKLAGNSYGRKLFEEQVDGKIDLDQPFVIEFPKQIDYMASSFIQGFFGKIYTEIGRDGMEKNFDIIAENISNPKSMMLDRLMLM